MQPERVMIVSLPKSGTYLLAEILTRLGHEPTHLHIGSESYDRYDPDRIQDGRDHPEKYRVRSPWQESLKQVRPGQFAVGHLPFDTQRLEALRDCRVLFLKREPRECLVSYMRWTLSTRRRERYPDAPWLHGDPRSQVVEFIKDRGWTLSNLFRSLLPWNAAPGVQAVRFEDLIDPAGIGLLGHDAAAVGAAAAEAQGVETQTRSAARTDLSDFWSDRAEAVYRLLFKDLHQRLGYPDETPLRAAREALGASGPRGPRHADRSDAGRGGGHARHGA